MTTGQKIRIMIGVTDPNYSDRLMERVKDIKKTEGQPIRKLKVDVYRTLAECQGKLSKKAHLMLLDFQETQSETEADLKQIRDYCKKHGIINVQSEEELLLAVSMMNKGIWDYVRP